MNVPRELVDQFVGLTNAEEPLANRLLLDSDLDVNAAVSLFFAIKEAEESGRSGTSSLPNGSAAGPPAPTTTSDAELAAALAAQDQAEADQVRAPIPQVVDTLLPTTAPRRSQAVRDPFVRPSGAVANDRLAELFQPPARLVFPGSFEDALTIGARDKRWILVTIHQADVFQCQVLNRDVWNNTSIQQVLEAYFVFWQRDIGSDDGGRYRQFYPFPQLPHIAIIDPRSGERVTSLNGGSDSFEAEVILRYLTEFASENSLENVDPVRRPALPGAAPGAVASSSRASAATPSAVAQPSVSDAADDLAATEDAQLAAAIAASIEAAGGATVDMDTSADGGPSSVMNGSAVSRQVSRQMSANNASLNRTRDLRAQQDMEYEESLAMDRAKEESKRAEAARLEEAREVREAKRRRVPVEPPAGAPGVTELVVRLPNNERIKRRFLDSHTIGAVYDFVETEAEQVSQIEFDLITTFPKKTLADRSMRIGDAGLSARALLVVHVR